MNSEMLLEMIGEIDPREVRSAREPVRRRRWPALCGIAAALATVVLVALPEGAEAALTTESVESLERLTASYDGTLLAENLVSAGAELSDIRLKHEKGTDITDTTGWRSLSFTAQSGAEKLEMTCVFDVPEDYAWPEEPTRSFDYNGLEVRLYMEPGAIGGETPCRAIFVSGGVIYDMTMRVSSPDSIDEVREYLDIIFAVASEDGEDLPDVPGGEELEEFAVDAGLTSYPELDYDGRWTFFVEERQNVNYAVYPEGTESHLMALDNRTGEKTDLTGAFRAERGKCAIGRFSDILGCDGVALMYSSGEVTEHTVFFEAGENEVSLLAVCDGRVYTGDINGDGIREIVYETGGDYPYTCVYRQGGSVVEDGGRVAAGESLTAVLKGEKNILVTGMDGESLGALSINDAGEALTEGGSEWFEAAQFAAVDMDGDGNREAVLRLCRRNDGTEMGFLVLHVRDGDAYGYPFYSREFEDLRIDGTFESSDSAANSEIHKLVFSVANRSVTVATLYKRDGDASGGGDFEYSANGKPCTMAEIDEAFSRQRVKLPAIWLELTEDNLEAAFG